MVGFVALHGSNFHFLGGLGWFDLLCRALWGKGRKGREGKGREGKGGEGRGVMCMNGQTLLCLCIYGELIAPWVVGRTVSALRSFPPTLFSNWVPAKGSARGNPSSLL